MPLLSTRQSCGRCEQLAWTHIGACFFASGIPCLVSSFANSIFLCPNPTTTVTVATTTNITAFCLMFSLFLVVYICSHALSLSSGCGLGRNKSSTMFTGLTMTSSLMKEAITLTDGVAWRMKQGERRKEQERGGRGLGFGLQRKKKRKKGKRKKIRVPSVSKWERREGTTQQWIQLRVIFLTKRA